MSLHLDYRAVLGVLKKLIIIYIFTARACPDGFSYNITYEGFAHLDKAGVRCGMPGLQHGYRKDCDFVLFILRKRENSRVSIQNAS